MTRSRTSRRLLWTLTALSIPLASWTTEPDLPVVESTVGEPVVASLGLAGGTWRVAVDGGLATPLDDTRVWRLGGRQLVAAVAPDGEVHWYDVRIAGEGRAGEPDRVLVDLDAPEARLEFEGPLAEREGRLFLSPATLIRAVGSDPSGVSELAVHVDGRPAESAPLEPGEHRLAVVAGDRAGNRAEVAGRRVVVDGEGPAIHWQVADQGLRAADGEPIYRSPVTLQVRAEDRGAGLESLAVVDSGRPVTGPLEVAADRIELEAADRLGNRSRTVARWRYDTVPPVITLRLNGVEQPSDGLIELDEGDAVELAAVDEGIGLARAEYRYNNGPWLPLPKSLRFEDWGRYLLDVRAEDRVGQVTRARWEVRAEKVRGEEP